MASQLDMFSDDEQPHVIKLEANTKGARPATSHLSEEGMLEALEAAGRLRPHSAGRAGGASRCPRLTDLSGEPRSDWH
ncbi:hypothetical protein [Rhizobium sp. YTU87027]|uniref:hypothetical protein n=1 Tax=Rhizobium sp. YTU87027 TaxID=3417741 RepID=UPI003D6808A5